MPNTSIRIVLTVLFFAMFADANVPIAAMAQVSTQNDPAAAVTTEPRTTDDPEISTDKLAHLLVPLTKPELEELAKTWIAIVKAKTQDVADKQVEFIEREGSVGQSEYDALARLVEQRAALLEKFSMVVSGLEMKGGDEALVKELRAYRAAVIAEETRLANPRALLNAGLEWLGRADGGLALVWYLVIIILSLGVLVLMARFSRRFVGRWIGRIPNLSKLLQAFLVAVVYWIVLVIGLLVVLSLLGVDITPVYAMIGGASFILAFAFQDTLSNLANGLMIMINRPFDEGNYVLVGGVGGTVQSVSIVATTITTPDNQVIVIPNKTVWGNVITNVTASETRRVDLVFGISYEDAIPDALRVMTETVKRHPLVLSDPEPTIRVNELAESSVNFVCRPWAKTIDYWTVYWDLTQQVKEAFDEANISIPYPQRDLHLKGGTELIDAN